MILGVVEAWQEPEEGRRSKTTCELDSRMAAYPTVAARAMLLKIWLKGSSKYGDLEGLEQQLDKKTSAATKQVVM